MKNLFLIIGAPGSGKTTDAELIAKNNENITHYSTGDMLRAEIASASVLGMEIDGYVSKGNIVPIDIVVRTITSALQSSPTEVVVIDGYPRSVEQMDALSAYLDSNAMVKLVSVIEVAVSEETARDRVLGRARGADDDNEVFNNRMKVYTDPLTAIQNFYNAKSILKVVSGEGTIKEIVDEMETFVKSKI